MNMPFNAKMMMAPRTHLNMVNVGAGMDELLASLSGDESPLSREARSGRTRRDRSTGKLRVQSQYLRLRANLRADHGPGQRRRKLVAGEKAGEDASDAESVEFLELQRQRKSNLLSVDLVAVLLSEHLRQRHVDGHNDNGNGGRVDEETRPAVDVVELDNRRLRQTEKSIFGSPLPFGNIPDDDNVVLAVQVEEPGEED